MLNIKEIEQHYTDSLKPFKRFILREYLQYKILEIIYNSQFASRLFFMGGTCLRIVYNNNRFSEDLDFDNVDLTENDFTDLARVINNNLRKEGYQIEIRNVLKGAFHCYIRFPGILFQERLTAFREEKILIQLDTEPQNFKFESKEFLLNKFDVFTAIKTTPEDILLSQKLFAILNRKMNKGRDFFDVVFLLGKTIPNYSYLDLKLGISTSEQLHDSILQKCRKVNFADMAKDVEPFLMNSNEIQRVLKFEQYFDQVKL